MGYYGKPSHTSDATKLTKRAVGEHHNKMFGVGVKANFTDTIGLHAGYDGFKADKGVDKDAHMINAGLDFKFSKDF